MGERGTRVSNHGGPLLLHPSRRGASAAPPAITAKPLRGDEVMQARSTFSVRDRASAISMIKKAPWSTRPRTKFTSPHGERGTRVSNHGGPLLPHPSRRGAGAAPPAITAKPLRGDKGAPLATRAVGAAHRPSFSSRST